MEGATSSYCNYYLGNSTDLILHQTAPTMNKYENRQNWHPPEIGTEGKTSFWEEYDENATNLTLQ